MNKQIILTVVLLLQICLVNSQTLPTYVPSNGLVGWWPFDGNANDESGNGNNGTVYGSTLSNDRFGSTNAAYTFDGIDDYISNLLNMNSTDSLTISLWYNSPIPNNISSTHFELWESSNTPNQIHLNFSFNPVPTGYMYTWITGIGQANDMMGTRSYNTWHHVVIVKAGGIETVYVDNVANFGIFTGSNITFQFDRFEIGREFTSSMLDSTYFNGSIDDIGMWNRVLDSTEINNLFNGQSTGIQNISSLDKINIYPNPATTTINIIKEDNFTNSVFTIYDVMGRIVLSGFLKSIHTEIAMNNLENGIYYITVNQQKAKLIKN